MYTNKQSETTVILSAEEIGEGITLGSTTYY